MKTGDIKRIAVVSVLLGSLASGCTAAYTTVKDEPRASVHLASVEAAQTFYDAHIMENYAWRRDDRDAGWSVSAGIDVPAPFERNKMVTDNVKFNNAIRETDTNHDGTISDAEAKAYAAKILRRNIPRSFQTGSKNDLPHDRMFRMRRWKACLPPISADNCSMKSVAIIGASNDRAKFGNKAVRACLQEGYTVYPVNPKEMEIEGQAAFKSIRDVPVRPEMISVYLPPPVLLKVLPDIAAKGCDELWLNPGTESDEVLAEAERLGLNVIQACSIVGVGVSPAEL